MRRTVLTSFVLAQAFLQLVSIAQPGNGSDHGNPVSLTVARAAPPPATTLPIGQLVHDGPATPEQLSLLIPVTGKLPTTAIATLRYKPSLSTNWIDGHPLHRIRPDFTLKTGAPVAVIDAFAWPIIGLLPGTSYDVEVTVTSGAVTVKRTNQFITRSLPGDAGAPTEGKRINSAYSTSQIQAILDGMNPGDVIEFADGTYDLLAELVLNRSGQPGNPIYIRGQSRNGVVLKRATRVFHIWTAKDIIIENLTIQGSGVDSGLAASSVGIEFLDNAVPQERITVRHVILTGIDQGIIASGETQGLLVYDNTLLGNNGWNQDEYANNGSGTPGPGDGIPDIEQNVFWHDDGILLPGLGNVAFNNTLHGFGDAMAVCSHTDRSVALAECRGIHYYRNDILMTGDDGTEGDYAFRNITFYDNRLHNTMTFVSLDPLYGGPYVAARNISINVGRSPYKFNNTNTGHFIYNNTVIRTNGNEGGWGWAQPKNGPLRAWGYQNNILIYQGTGNLMAMSSTGQTPIDFSHNCFYPADRQVWWTNSGGNFSNLLAAYNGLPATTPVFSGLTKRHASDLGCEANPFATPIDLGTNFRTELAPNYIPELSLTTVARHSGVKIANITDGSQDPNLPDRGAIITGISTPQWGDRTP